MNKMCPQCKTINPPVRESNGMHFLTYCKHQIGIKSYIFGLIVIPKYCNAINEFDMEDDDWIYLNDKNENTNKEKEMKTIKCKDKGKNKISLEGITAIIENTQVDCELDIIGAGILIKLYYATNKDRSKMKKRLNKKLNKSKNTQSVIIGKYDYEDYDGDDVGGF